MHHLSPRVVMAAALVFAWGASAQLTPKPIPRMAAVPLPHHQISFQRDGVELTRFHYDPDDKRSFLYPLNGPGGVSLTRMGHPHDPFTHSHHNSLWLSHHDVNGVSFWDDKQGPAIRCLRVEKLEDDDEFASATVLHVWLGTNGLPMLFERRRMTVHPLPDKEWLLTIELRLDPAQGTVTLGKTPFGLIGVRMARSIGVHDGGGVIRSSEGGINEKGVHWKPARWVDYSGATASNRIEGITLFDHPSNPNHPSVFHVRDDGWMGAALTYAAPLTIGSTNSLQLRYGLYVHGGLRESAVLDRQWKQFTSLTFTNLSKAKP